MQPDTNGDLVFPESGMFSFGLTAFPVSYVCFRAKHLIILVGGKGFFMVESLHLNLRNIY
jgi:hypothetical protein